MKSSITGKFYKLPTESLSLIEDYWTLANETKYIYDGWNVVAEFSGTGLISKSYLWGLDLSGSMQGAGGVGGLLSIEQHLGDGASRHYVAYDGNGNVVGLANADSGEMSALYEYSAFGEVLQMEGSYAVKNDYKFSTKPQEGMTGLYYYGFRWLDAGQGRWLSRDPIGELGGVNLYGFIGNNGLNWVDVLGLYKDPCASLCDKRLVILKGIRETMKLKTEAVDELTSIATTQAKIALLTTGALAAYGIVKGVLSTGGKVVSVTAAGRGLGASGKQLLPLAVSQGEGVVIAGGRGGFGTVTHAVAHQSNVATIVATSEMGVQAVVQTGIASEGGVLQRIFDPFNANANEALRQANGIMKVFDDSIIQLQKRLQEVGQDLRDNCCECDGRKYY